jgi:Helix-turn-helix domain
MPKYGRQTPQAEAVTKSAIIQRVQSRPALTGALKLQEARQYLGGLSIPTMHRLIKRGLIKPNRALRHILFPIRELDRFLAEGQS